ncbi:MAG: trimeric intracellular cation channel family protein [Rhodococcus sp. (in: high G+C Gram-positive bacteria)]
MLLTALEYVGIIAFVASGALVGVRKGLDFLGVCVLGITTGIGGGIIRDTLIGIHPPTSMTQWPIIATALVTSLVVFKAHLAIGRIWRGVVLLDAVGLGLFCTTGAAITLDNGGGVVAACMLGSTSAVAGGVLRDTLVNDVPLLFRGELYAVPALIGAVAVVVADALGGSGNIGLVVGTLLATGLRIAALKFDWHLPVARGISPEQ